MEHIPDATWGAGEDMTQRGEIAHGENVVLEFKEARPMDSLKYLKTVVAFANGRGWRTVSNTSRQFE